MDKPDNYPITKNRVTFRVERSGKVNEYFAVENIEALPRKGEIIEYCRERFEKDPLVGVVENVTHEFTSNYKVIVDIREFDYAT